MDFREDQPGDFDGSGLSPAEVKILKLLKTFLEASKSARKYHSDFDPDHCFGDFLLHVKDAVGFDHRKAGPAHERLVTHYKAALVGSGGTTGGYLVPPELRHDLEKTADEFAIFRPRALVVPMSSQQLELDLPDQITPQSAGTPPWYGGILLKWAQDAAARAETAEPKFRQVTLNAWDLTGYALASNNLVGDAPALNAFLLRLFGLAKAWYEDYAFIQGDGVGKPLGIVQSPGSKLVTRSGAADFTITDSKAMLADLLPVCYDRAVWLVHPTVLVKMTGQTGWIPNGPLQLHGRPIIVTDKCSTLGTKGDVILCDPSFYVIGDRQELIVAVSAHEPTAFLKSQSVFRLLARLDGRPWFEQVITLPDGTSTASASVVLV